MILDDIVAWKRTEVEKRKLDVPLAAIEARANEASPRDFEGALVHEGRLSVLAEIKRASPSAGLIRGAADPGALASAMEAANAEALSVLTDSRYFSGSFEDLTAARAAVSLPVLEKDFVVDEYQLYEAAALGADAVLLIVRVLSDAELAAFYKTAGSLDLGCLVEVHTREELARASAAGAALVGINNRDLATFTVDIATTLELMPYVPRGMKVVSQSGISTPEQALALYEAGVSAIQVGESIMRAEDPGAKIRRLRSLVD